MTPDTISYRDPFSVVEDSMSRTKRERDGGSEEGGMLDSIEDMKVG